MASSGERDGSRVAAEMWGVGVGGLEPPTSALSELRSNRLSYTPATGKGTTRILQTAALFALGNQ